MILIWRVWGLLAVVALFPLLTLWGSLATVEPKWVPFTAVVLSLLVGGMVCVHFSTRWNLIPLQIWGWTYLALVTLIGLFWGIAGLAYATGYYQPPKPDELGRITVISVAGVAILCVVGVFSYLVTRPAGESDLPATEKQASGTDG